MDRFDLTSLTVRTFYGHALPGVSAAALGPGVNVVYGPNGQGKTTMARAIHGVLWPDTVAAARPSYTAAFRVGGDDWRVVFEGGVPRYEREGRPADRVPLPDSSYRDRYEFSLGDLLSADGDAFADIVRRDAAGGVDLEAAREALGFKSAPTQRLKLTGEAEEAARAVQRRRLALDGLRAREDRLGELAERATEAADAAELAELYRLLDEAAARAEAAQAADRVVGSFDAALASVQADTLDRYHALTAAVRKAETRRSDVEASRAEARAALAEHGWDAVTAPEPAELRARSVDADAAARALEAAESARASAAERERRARESLGGHIDIAPTVDVTALGDVAAFAQRAGRLRGRVDEFEARRSAAKARLNAVRFHDADELRRASDLLRRWLAHTTETETTPVGLGARPVWIGAAVVAAVAIALAIFLTPLAWSGLAGAAALAVVAFVLGRKQEASASPAVAARQAYAALSVPSPAEWTVPVVQKTLDGLERQTVEQKERDMWKDAVEELDRALVLLEAETAAIDAEAAELGNTLGIGAPDTPEALHLLTRGVLAWQEAARDLGVADAARDGARGAVETALELFNHALDGLPIEPVTDAASAAGAVARVEREVAERDRLRTNAARLDDAAGDADAALDEATGERDEFLERLGLEEPAATAVASLCAARPAYTAALDEAARAHALADEATTRAQSHARYTEAAGALDRPALAEALSAAEARAARRDEWIEEKTAIQTLVGEARRADALAGAHAEHARALDALERTYDEQADALVGHALAEHIDAETRDQHLPQVFKRAREVLADITDDRFRLEFDADATTFRAFDAQRGRSFGLDELSSGTRLQLLLAVRLAFAEQQEVGLRLPILLDEALANSDDDRAGAIVEAVLRLCRQGRQVFYFTAQAEEVVKWRRLAAQQPDVDCRFLALPDTAALAAVDLAATPTLAATRPVPDPAGATPDAYADAAGVAPWSAWDALDALHLWYLLDDPEDVAACLRRGYATWGQLRAAIERGKPAPVADVGALEVRARAVAAWREAWRQGRGTPVDREVLEASGAVTTAFLDDVDALCGDTGGDAEALLACLDRGGVGRFQERQVEKLAAFLAEAGYLSPDDRLSDDEVRRRVAEAVPVDAVDDALAVLARIRHRAETVRA